MAIASYAYIGIKNLIFKNKQTGEVVTNVKHLVDLNLTDEMQEDFLKGGYGMNKLLSVYSGRETKLDGTTATQTTGLNKIMSNNDIALKTKADQQVEDIAISGGKFTLKLDPSAGETITVFSVDSVGKETKLTLGAVSNANEYTIAGKVISCHASVTKIRVFYMASVEVETLEIRDITPKNWAAVGILVAKEIESGKLFKCTLDMPNVSVAPNFNASFKNSEGAPDPVSLSISLMMDEGKGYVYAMNFSEEK